MKNFTFVNLFIFSILLLSPSIVMAEIETQADLVNDIYGKAKVPTYLVAEFPSGKIIAGKNIDAPNQIASLTKLVTAYTARAEKLNLEKSILFQKKKFSTGIVPKKAFRFSENEAILNKDVLELMLVISNNSASRMLALATGLKEKDFIKKMNQNVVELGMNNTFLFDTSGLNNKNVSTARDMLTIFMADLADPELFSALGQTVYTFQSKLGKKSVNHTIHSSNLIPNLYKNLNYNILASKTGYSGKVSSMAMLVKNKSKNKQYIVITLGNPNYNKRFLAPHEIAKWIGTKHFSDLLAADIQ
ncbi:MAG: serine hydrolase [Patescibacteria group bacterium]